MNKILYHPKEGTTGLFLISNCDDSDIQDSEHILQIRKQEAINNGEIVNPEEIERKLYQNDERITGPMSSDAWKRIILKDGDTFDLPEGVQVEGHQKCGYHNLNCSYCGTCAGSCYKPIQYFRLVKEQPKQEMKEYTLQDAKDEIALQTANCDFNIFQVRFNQHAVISVMNGAAKLYASKVTEELRKENEALKEWKRQQIEVTGPIFEWGHQNHKDIPLGNSIVQEVLKRLEEHKLLKESNKELFEALKDTVTRMTRARAIVCGKNMDDWQMLNASKYEPLIQKSEGYVNK